MRDHFLALFPASTLTLHHRSEYPDEGKIVLLDANENAFGPSIAVDDTNKTTKAGLTIQSVLDPSKLRLNRYPDAYVHVQEFGMNEQLKVVVGSNWH